MTLQAQTFPCIFVQNQNKLPLLLSILTFLSTLLGGLLAIRFKNKLGIILGFSAGAVIGVVFFDLLPESFSIGESRFGVSTISAVMVAGFLFYMLLDRLSVLHTHQHGNTGNHRGKIGASSLSIHSLLDGVAIGIAFQVSVPIGILIAVAVIAHDFADGVNTVSVILKDGGKNKLAYRWLIIDAAAPIIGVLSTMFYRIPDTSFSLLLAVFSGFFLYIGASDLLPESREKHPGFLATLMTILGVALLFVASLLAKI